MEDEKEEKPKTKKVEKTTWDWELVNDMKPIWMRKTAEVEDDEYNEFYKSIAKESDDPLAHVSLKNWQLCSVGSTVEIGYKNISIRFTGEIYQNISMCNLKKIIFQYLKLHSATHVKEKGPL